ncbi:MFS transporter [Limobrevibacterium gyesilva]|uniref:MFS transporter n=1 Tax=Limobrevibacterium gyesilva TaxID=2991712 RepID=A0AA41YUB7_9PROT|nr:MFS transporter [Limobrevibacterium gyesilva]MCW3476635.1 MFS transporter [Limobrevibacterium gyesilva]
MAGTLAARRATRLVFLLVGIATATWAPLVPDAKLRLGLDDAGLGLVLLGLGGGALAATTLAGLATHRFGGRVVMLAGGFAACATLPALALAPSAALLAAALTLFGAALGAVDIAMNAQAVVVERAAARPLLSGFHGMFSLGGLLGAAGVSVLLLAGVSPAAAAGAVAVLLAALLLSQARFLLPHLPQAGNALVLPRGRLALLGGLCFIAFLAEGAILDWSAVFLRFSRGADVATAGLGYAAFSVTMALTRLCGDALTARAGAVRMLRLGALVAAAGFAAASALPQAWASLLGFAVVGLGLANMVPLLLGAAGRLPGIPAGPAISAAATPGYVGLLLGPALVGFAASRTGLPVALAGLCLLLLCVLACARRAMAGRA